MRTVLKSKCLFNTGNSCIKTKKVSYFKKESSQKSRARIATIFFHRDSYFASLNKQLDTKLKKEVARKVVMVLSNIIIEYQVVGFVSQLRTLHLVRYLAANKAL